MDEEELRSAFNEGFNDDIDSAESAISPLDETIAEPEPLETSDYARFEQLLNDRLEINSREIEARVEEKYQKVTGKLGEFNKRLLDAQATGKSLKITKDDLKYVTENFGEDFAEGLAQDLAGLGGVSNSDDSSIKEYVAEIEAKHNDHVISLKHKGWKAEIGTPEFSEWFGGLSPDAQQDSENPIDIVEMLDSYKELKALKADQTFTDWRQSIGTEIPNDTIVATFKGWQEIGAIAGFADWAKTITDENTRYRIGRDTDRQFMDAAKKAFLNQKGLENPAKATQKNEQRPVNKRLESAILPTTTSDYSGQGNSLRDHFLAGWEED